METAQTAVYIHGILVLRERQIRIKKKNTKTKQNEKKTKQNINPGRKCITLFPLSGPPLFLPSIESADISFLSHLIPKEHFWYPGKVPSWSIQKIYFFLVEILHEAIFVLALISLLLFPIGITMRTSNHRFTCCVQEWGLGAATFHSASWARDEEPREVVWREAVL